MPTTEIRIKGQRELEAAFLQLKREVLTELKPELLRIAQVVQKDSSRHLVSDGTAPRNIKEGDRWAIFRAGATVKGAYVAPKARRRGGSGRPNMGRMMFTSMTEARDENETYLVTELDALVNASSARAGFF